MKRTVLMLMALLAAVGCVLAQPRTVTGVVTSAEDGSTLPQLAVQIKGSGTGVVTDLDGRYSIQVSGPEVVLVFAYVGMQNQEITVGENTTINVVMQPANEEIDPVVVTAYGTQKRSSLTGSVTSVDAKKLEKLPGTDVTKAMEGQLAGVTISSSSGAPGSATTIRIRGIGSINASNSPLIILDGAPYDGSLNSINPADIESYNVLKDAASAALYGARAANGVILITTKQGRAGQTVVNYDGRIGYNFRGVPEYDMITDPGQYYEASWRSLRNSLIADGRTEKEAGELASKYLLTGDQLSGITGLGGYNIYKGVNWDEVVLPNGTLNPKAKDLIFADKKDWNDWHKALFQPQLRQEHNLSVSKGLDHTNVYFSLSYLDDNGYSLNSYFKRFTSRLNVTQQIYKWLDFSNKFQFVYSDRNSNAGGGLVQNPFGYVRNIAPIYPIYRRNLDGSITKNIDGGNEFEDGTGQLNGADHIDPATGKRISYPRPRLANTNLRASQVRDLRQTRSWIINNVAGLVAHLPWNLQISTNVAYTGEFYKGLNRQAKFGDAQQFGGRLSATPEEQHGINTTQIVDWHWSFLEKDALNVAMKVGHEAYFMNHEYLYASRTGLLYEEATQFQYAAKFESLTGHQRGYSLEGFFAQLSSDYLSRYSLSASVRRDGSSVFHPDHRWGNFWSVGAAWRISSEPFFAKATDYVNSLKLRVSYGLQGNDYINSPDGYRNWTPYQNLFEVTNDGKVSTSPYLLGNKEVTWEKNYNLSAAIEYGFLQNLVYGEIEFFNRMTRDMLFNLPVPASTGYTTKPTNIGDMRNTGVEFTINVNPIRTENVSLTFNLNATHYKNVITRLPDKLRKEGIRNGSKLLKEGHSIYSYHLLHWMGVNPENGHPLYSYRKTSDGEWKTLEREKGANDQYLEHSRKWAGRALPDVSGGFGMQLEAYGIDFSAQFSYAIGGKIIDNGYGGLMGSASFGDALHKDMLKSWTPENRSTKYPIHEKDNSYGAASDRYLIDGSYLSFRSVVLGYTLPVRWTQRALLQQVRIYGVCDGVWLWSRRKGLDPRQFLNGVGGDNYSAIRTVSLGLQVKF